MNWVYLAIGFAIGCGYSTIVTFVLAWFDRHEELWRQSRGE